MKSIKTQSILPETNKNEYWDEISRSNLREENINENAQHLNWTLVLKNNLLSDEQLENNIDFLDFDMVSAYQNPGINFLEKHISQLNLYRLMKNKKIPNQFFFKHLDQFSIDELVVVRALESTIIRDEWQSIRNCHSLNKKIISAYKTSQPKEKTRMRYVVTGIRCFIGFLWTAFFLVGLVATCFFVINLMITGCDNNTNMVAAYGFIMCFTVIMLLVENKTLNKLIDYLFLHFGGPTGKYDYLISDEYLLLISQKQIKTHQKIRRKTIE